MAIAAVVGMVFERLETGITMATVAFVDRVDLSWKCMEIVGTVVAWTKQQESKAYTIE